MCHLHSRGIISELLDISIHELRYPRRGHIVLMSTLVTFDVTKNAHCAADTILITILKSAATYFLTCLVIADERNLLLICTLTNLSSLDFHLTPEDLS